MSARSDARASRRHRRPVARHGVLKSPNPFMQLLTVLGVMALVVVISGGTVGAFALWDAARSVNDNSVALEGDDAGALPPTIGEIEGGVNMLVVGTDSCEGDNAALSGACQNRDTDGERNDVTMLVNISDEPRRVTVVSIPRDMIVPIPSCPNPDGGRYSSMSAQMLNVSYMYGGLPCTVLTVEELTGVDIQFAAAIRWTGVINMSDAIGGVDVCLSSPIRDGHTGIDWPAGNRTLVGTEALQFLRLRHGVGDSSDLARISNQQQFMGSMIRKLQSSEVLGDPTALFKIATTALQQVNNQQLVLSESLANPTRMVQIAMAAKDVPFEDIKFVQYPTEYTGGGGRVVPVTDTADLIFEAIAENRPLTLTGDPSQGYGVEVVGEADQAGDTAPASPEAPATDPAAPEAQPGTETPAPTDAIELPSSVAGSSAAQVTCTVGQQR